MSKAVALTALAITACVTPTPTPYGKYGFFGGFRDNRIDANTFSISVDNNGFTSQQTTSMHAIYRAAELTIENGFDYFVIASSASNPSSMAMAMPSASTSVTTAPSYGTTATAMTTTQHAPITVIPIVFPNSTLLIKSFKGEKPMDQTNAYDASEVMKYLGPQIGIKPAK